MAKNRLLNVQAICHLMQQKAIGRAKLANDARLNIRTIDRALSGEPVSADTIQRIAAALEVDPEEITSVTDIPQLFDGGLTVTLQDLQKGRYGIKYAIKSRLEDEKHHADDISFVSVVVEELLNNAVFHSDRKTFKVNIISSKLTDDDLNLNSVAVRVSDKGNGFDLHHKIEEHAETFSSSGHEHGLLRCFRLGSFLGNGVANGWHYVECSRAHRPNQLISRFSMPEGIVAVILDFEEDCVAIKNKIYKYFEVLPVWNMMLENPHFGLLADFFPPLFDLLFDPIRRESPRWLVIEIRGQHGTVPAGSVPPTILFSAKVLRFVAVNCPDVSVAIFADSMPEDQKGLKMMAEKNERDLRKRYAPSENDIKVVVDAISSAKHIPIEFFESSRKFSQFLKENA